MDTVWGVYETGIFTIPFLQPVFKIQPVFFQRFLCTSPFRPSPPERETTSSIFQQYLSDGLLRSVQQLCIRHQHGG
jgi:hypothetical protein